MAKRYNGIDLFKFIFSIVVVMIHTTPLMDVSEEVSWFFNAIIGNAAVPFFFTASGFLFFNNWRSLNAADKKRKLKKYVLHIFRMYIIWSLIFLPWKILNINTVGWSLKAVAQYVWDFVFVTSGDALWYLPSLIFSIYIIYLRKSNE